MEELWGNHLSRSCYCHKPHVLPHRYFKFSPWTQTTFNCKRTEEIPASAKIIYWLSVTLKKNHSSWSSWVPSSPIHTPSQERPRKSTEPQLLMTVHKTCSAAGGRETALFPECRDSALRQLHPPRRESAHTLCWGSLSHRVPAPPGRSSTQLPTNCKNLCCKLEELLSAGELTKLHRF